MIDSPFPSNPNSYLLKGEKITVTAFSGPQLPPSLIADVMEIQPSSKVSLIGEQCTEPERVPPGAAAPVFAPLLAPIAVAAISALVQYTAAQVTSAVQEWASTFDANWSGRYVGNFYAAPPIQNASGLANVRLTSRCFAVERTVDADRANRPVFIFVGRFDQSLDKTALRVVPLYLAYTGTKARVGSGGHFSSALQITIESVWLDMRKDIAATRNTVFTSLVSFGQLNLKQPPPGNIPPARQEALASGWFPFVPVTRGAKGDLVGSGPYTMTVTVTETAQAKDLAGTFAKGVIDLTGKAQAAIQAQIKQ